MISDRLSATIELMIATNRILASSFDLTQTLPEVARLCVPAIADYLIIQLLPRDGQTVPAAVATAAGVQAVQPDGMISPEFLSKLAGCGLQSYFVAPMVVNNETLGSLAIASCGEAEFDESTRQIAQMLAARIGAGVHTITSFAREHRVADRLQQALLPRSFPAVTGLTFSGEYRPASEEAEVGGDWYDAFALPDGRVAISIGDVAGHGLEAAVIMGEVRQALRAAAVVTEQPTAVLEAVNQVINLREGIGMVTAIFGFYDPASSVLRYAVAGHPPPIVATADGFADTLPGGGLPLGASGTVGARDWVFTIPPGGRIVLYTDGLIEYERDIEGGIRQLLDAVAAERLTEASASATSIQGRVFANTPNKDDAAVLTLTRSADACADVHLVFSAIPLVSALVRSTLRQICSSLECSSDTEFSLLVAVGEAIANAVEHAYGDREPGLLNLRTHFEGSRFIVNVDDYGRWRPFARREERGRGIPLMHALCDGVQIKSTQNSTSITLSIDLKREATA